MNVLCLVMSSYSCDPCLVMLITFETDNLLQKNKLFVLFNCQLGGFFNVHHCNTLIYFNPSKTKY